MALVVEAGTEQARRLAEELDLERMANLLKPLANPLRLQLLRFLTVPHYLEEIASHVRMTRQATRKHVDKLVGIGVLDRRSGVRDRGPVTEYVINPQALFLIHDEFGRMGSLRREDTGDLLHRTIAVPGHRPEESSPVGACFTIVRGFDVGRRFPMSQTDGRRWIIGRDPVCDLVVPHDPFVSNRHGEVFFERARFILVDLGSTNGTRHNWKALPRRGSVPLRHGDVVGVGKTLLLFWGEPG